MLKYLFHNNKLRLSILLMVQTCYTIGTVLVALLLNYLIDTIASSIATQNIPPLIRCAFFCFVYAILFGFIVFLSEKQKAATLKHLMLPVRQQILNGILQKSTSDFQSANSAEYITVLGQNLDTFEEKYLKNLLSMYDALVSILTSAVTLLLIHPLVAVISIIAMAIPSLIPHFFGTKLGERQRHIMERTSAYNLAVKDIFNGFEVIRAFGVDDIMKKRHQLAALEIENSKNNLAGTMSYLYSITNMASIAVQFLIMSLSGLFAMKGYITIGSIVAVTQLSGQVIAPAFQLSEKWSHLKSVKPVCSQILQIISPKENPLSTHPSRKLHTALTLDHVAFSYENAPTLENVCAQFEAGKKYAIVGKSGSGKSTLLKLLAGYYTDYSGHILVDNENARCDSSMISQHVFLFDDTIRNNITLFQDYPAEAIASAVRIAGLEELLAKLEKGLDTRVAENGARFSGGEKQRIAIARAVLHHKNVLLLDEATSALDNENAKKTEQNFLSLKDITCIAVTHKLFPENLGSYDKIFVMENGKVLQQGTFPELLEHSDLFQQLYYAGV